jgi:TPR repeat protein
MRKHLLEAAERGDAEAQFNLGIICENGVDDNRYAVEGSRSEAEKWFLAAAEQGLPRAQIKLAEMYAADPETLESSIKACTWFLLAIAHLRGAQLQVAQSAHQRAALRLTSAQLAEVQQLVMGWRPKSSMPAAISNHEKII